MAETVANLASLLKLGANLPLQPPRFAKVTAVSGDTVTVSLGSGTADAVRCCACAVDDVVLLETMPSGTLAAVATKGASGGGGVQSVTVGTVSGATFANSGTAENVVLDLSVPGYTLGTEGNWTYRKWDDGTAECWARFEDNVTNIYAWGSCYSLDPQVQKSYPTSLFTSTPIETGTIQCSAFAVIQAVNNAANSTTTTKKYLAMRPNSASISGAKLITDIYASGRWQ